MLGPFLISILFSKLQGCSNIIIYLSDAFLQQLFLLYLYSAYFHKRDSADLAVVFPALEFFTFSVEIVRKRECYKKQGDCYYEHRYENREEYHYVEISPVGIGVAYIVIPVAFPADVRPHSHD